MTNKIMRSAIVDEYLSALDEALDHPIRSDHAELIVQMPKGAWRWASLDAFAGKQWPPARVILRTSFAVADVAISLGSEVEEARLIIISSFIEDGETPTRTISLSGRLTPIDLRSFVMSVLGAYAPLSVSITTSE